MSELQLKEDIDNISPEKDQSKKSNKTIDSYLKDVDSYVQDLVKFCYDDDTHENSNYSTKYSKSFENNRKYLKMSDTLKDHWKEEYKGFKRQRFQEYQMCLMNKLHQAKVNSANYNYNNNNDYNNIHVNNTFNYPLNGRKETY